MNLVTILLIALTVVWVIREMSRDIARGMRLVLALLVFLPTSLRIELPGALPQLTIHRILIVLAFVFLIQKRDPNRPRQPIPHLGLVLLFGLSQFVSLLFGSELVSGLKGCFNYAIEVVLFYVFISEYVQTETDHVKLLSSICYGLAGVAVLATVEKYLNINLVAKVLPLAGDSLSEVGDIDSTYPHRILLGYAMAMGIPLALALSTRIEAANGRWRMYGIALLLIGATYFSRSRGPWLGLGIVLVGMASLGGKRLRKQLLYIALISTSILIWRPGVYDTIRDLYRETVDPDSPKGGSYQTRWQLWTIALTEIQRSPERLLFGYGPLASERMDFSDYFYGQEGWLSSVNTLGYTSWDNNYACDLFELGGVGFGLEALLLLSVGGTLVQRWRKSAPENRVIQGGIGVACLVFVFALTNVFLFAPQLKYLFWGLVAVGNNSSSEPEYPTVMAPRPDRVVEREGFGAPALDAPGVPQ